MCAYVCIIVLFVCICENRVEEKTMLRGGFEKGVWEQRCFRYVLIRIFFGYVCVCMYHCVVYVYAPLTISRFSRINRTHSPTYMHTYTHTHTYMHAGLFPQSRVSQEQNEYTTLHTYSPTYTHTHIHTRRHVPTISRLSRTK
jgi:hypothetical protein